MIRKLLVTAVVAAGSGMFGGAAAQSRFDFVQGGFEEGATVSGFFVGDDLDGNGQLSGFAGSGEILDFSATFSGNSLVASFTLGLSDLFGLVYDLDGGPLGDGLSLAIEGIGADDGVFSYQAGPGPVAECGIGIICAFVSDGIGSSSSMQLILIGAGLGGSTAVSPSSAVTSGEVLTQTASVVPTLIAQQLANSFFGFTFGRAGTISQREEAEPAEGLAAGDGAGWPSSAWASYSRVNLRNDLSSTAFDSTVSIYFAGADWYLTDALLVGLGAGYEDSDTSTLFNRGGQESEGVTLAAYAGYLLNDSWSVDATIGGATVDTDQFRSLAGQRIASEVDSTRFFAAANVNSFYEFDAWLLSTRLGLLYSRSDFDSFTESAGAMGSMLIPEQEVDVAQLSLGADVGYDFDGVIPYLSATFVHDIEEAEVSVAAGQAQPSGDSNEFQLGLGVRYFGESVSGSVELQTVQGREDIENFTVTATLRIEI